MSHCCNDEHPYFIKMGLSCDTCGKSWIELLARTTIKNRFDVNHNPFSGRNSMSGKPVGNINVGRFNQNKNSVTDKTQSNSFAHEMCEKDHSVMMAHGGCCSSCRGSWNVVRG